MKNANIKAIILGHKNIGEKDKLIFLYCPEFGKMRAIARGCRNIKSRFSGHLETLNIINAALYFGPRNTLITEVCTLSGCKNIDSCFQKSAAGLLISEITNHLLYDGQSIEGLFALIEETILSLKTTNKPFIISAGYIIKLLNLLGLIPNFRTLNTRLDKKYLKFFEYAKYNSYSKMCAIRLSAHEEKRIKSFLKNYIEHHTEKDFKSLTY
ncbi:DNA repair protein RecO [Candidatus Peregrinibacteria bacterium]|nr:DNA repair protein RecO [Candidatus Peregrinibacteria bacterium]